MSCVPPTSRGVLASRLPAESKMARAQCGVAPQLDNLDVSLTRSERWIVISSGSRTSSEASVLPAADPTAPPTLVRARSEDVEYGVDDWVETRYLSLGGIDR